MLSQVAYVRQQIQSAQRAGTPSARADHLQRALDGLERVESQAKDIKDVIDDCLRNHRRYQPDEIVLTSLDEIPDNGRVEVVPGWTLPELLAREA